LSTVLYGFEMCSLTLREEDRLRVVGNRVLRRIFGPKRNEVIGEWMKPQGGADKSLARPGRKQATVKKLGIYSMYSP